MKKSKKALRADIAHINKNLADTLEDTVGARSAVADAARLTVPMLQDVMNLLTHVVDSMEEPT